MKLYVLICSADCTGEGLWQDTIKSIYQSHNDAVEALQQSIDNEVEDGNYGCVYNVQWEIQTHELIPATSKQYTKQYTDDPSTWPSIK